MTGSTGARLRAHAWGYRYPGRADPALSGVGFTVEPGELVVLLGASGSGKSTLLAALAGVLPDGDQRGSLHVLDAHGAPVTRIGLVQQDPESNLVMETVGDDLAFPLESAAVDPARIWPRVRRARDEVGLHPSVERRTASLSGGQQQLLAVAAATIADPTLLLLDEPTANLDPTAAEAVVRAVLTEQSRTGCTVVVVEHRIEPWLARADLALLADSGTVTAFSPGALRAHLAAHPRLGRRAWLDHTHLPRRGPVGAPGRVALQAHDLSVAGRLAALDLTCRRGEVVALTGAPGSGKSTLLACLGGLLRPSSGRVDLGDGRADPWDWPAPQVADTFGIVFQDPEHQFLTGSVRAELEHAAGLPERSTDDVAALLDRLHLGPLAAADPFSLSGGEQRRLSVGTALVHHPEVLLLDEPTFGQDPATWGELVELIAEHRDTGGAVVLATHDPHLVTALAAREVRLAPVVAEDGAQRERIVPAPAPGLRSLDPVALLLSAALVSAAALLSASIPLNLGIALGAVAAALLGGLRARRMALLAVPAGVAALSVALSNALLGTHGLLAAESWSAAALPASRVLAVSLPGLVAAVAMDPTGLADSLVARLRVRPRAAYSVLAGLRLLPLLSDQWQILGRASRARGLSGRGVAGRTRMFASMSFRLLVGALRRGGRLAVALDARGLTAGTARTIARPLRWRLRDTSALVVASMLLVAALSSR